MRQRDKKAGDRRDPRQAMRTGVSGDPERAPARRSVVVAVTSEDDRFRSARVEGQRQAAERGSTLLLYDWDAPTLFGAPLPTWWSGEGSEEMFGRRLGARELEAAGRSSIARQVRSAEASGISAGGWLPSDHGPEALARYALEESADIVVVPADLLDVAGLEAILDGTDKPIEALRDEVNAKVIVAN